jgi:hypothetical protein
MWPFASKQEVHDELTQVSADLADKIQSVDQILLGEIRDHLTSKIQSLEQTLLGEMQKVRVTPELHMPPDLLQMPKKVDQVQKQLTEISVTLFQLTQSSKKLDQLHQQIEDLAILVNHLSPTLPTGEQKPIHDKINVHILAATSAISALAQEHASWLEQHLQAFDRLQQSLSASQEYALVARAQIEPPPGGNGTEKAVDR